MTDTVVPELSDELVQAGLKEVFSQADAAFKWSIGTTEHRPEPGSSLAQDDLAADPFQLSHIVSSLIQVAAEHLEVVRVLIFDAKVLHLTAPFTLIRGAIESASFALWILSGETSVERVCRRLRLATKDIRNNCSALKSLGVEPPQANYDNLAQALAMAKAVTGNGQFKLSDIKSTEVVESAALSSGTLIKVLAAWKVCSGFAHGMSWSSVGILLREEVKGNDIVSIKFRNTPSRVLWAARGAADVLVAATALYEESATNHSL